MAAGRKNRIYFEIYGSKASVEFNGERPNELWIGRRNRESGIMIKDPSLMASEACEITTLPVGHNEGFNCTFKQLYRKIYGYMTGQIKDIQYPTFEAGLREMIICEKLIQSNKEERWITV